MAIRANNWNIVIVGHWNKAILTPNRVGKKIFELSDNTAVEVFIPLDAPNPFRIIYDDITVAPSDDRLIVEPKESTFECLFKALAIARNALRWLPETPLVAAGINVRFEVSPSEIPSSYFGDDWDEALALRDSGTISTRMCGRAIPYETGTAKIIITENDNSEELQLDINFHYGCNENKKLSQFLDPDVDKFKDIVKSILSSLDLKYQEENE